VLLLDRDPAVDPHRCSPSPELQRRDPTVKKRHANRQDVLRAIEKHQPFSAIPNVLLEIVLPEAYPTGDKWRKKKHRALIRRLDTEEIMITATSTYELVDKIEGGWKYEPNKKEGLFI